MALAQFRRSGGSTIVTLPASVVEAAVADGLSPEAGVEVAYDAAARTITMRSPRPRYTMADLLAQCDLDAPLTDEDKAWLDDAPTGSEAI